MALDWENEEGAELSRGNLRNSVPPGLSDSGAILENIQVISPEKYY